MQRPGATIYVCVTCRVKREGEGDAFHEPGRALAAKLKAHIEVEQLTDVEVRPVECLAVCKRPCTIALTGPDKWLYVIGDLDEHAHVDEIIAAGRAYAATDNGIVPWKERPQTFRKGVISRIPPPSFHQPPPSEPA